MRNTSEKNGCASISQHASQCRRYKKKCWGGAGKRQKRMFLYRKHFAYISILLFFKIYSLDYIYIYSNKASSCELRQNLGSVDTHFETRWNVKRRSSSCTKHITSPAVDAICYVAAVRHRVSPAGRPSNHVIGVTHFIAQKQKRSSL